MYAMHRMSQQQWEVAEKIPAHEDFGVVLKRKDT